MRFVITVSFLRLSSDARFGSNNLNSETKLFWNDSFAVKQNEKKVDIFLKELFLFPFPYIVERKNDVAETFSWRTCCEPTQATMKNRLHIRVEIKTLVTNGFSCFIRSYLPHKEGRRSEYPRIPLIFGLNIPSPVNSCDLYPLTSFRYPRISFLNAPYPVNFPPKYLILMIDFYLNILYPDNL